MRYQIIWGGVGAPMSQTGQTILKNLYVYVNTWLKLYLNRVFQIFQLYNPNSTNTEWLKRKCVEVE